MPYLPKSIDDAQVPPIKCQGIKTDLVDFISASVSWDGEGRWIEPFLGSGVVLFNLEPERALVADKNKHIIQFYRGIQEGEITGRRVRNFLEKHGERLERQGEEYYYEMRDRFNENNDVLYLLFLNRSCYNGMMRFNSDGEFNVPFCKKPKRFRKAYVTKIVNQVKETAKIIRGKNWEFKAWDWEKTLDEAGRNDFIYLDPPYIGRNTGYIGKWEEDEARKLARVTQESDAGYALSMWKENKYRQNEHIIECWDDNVLRTHSHFYYVGSTEDLRNEMIEALVIKEGYEAPEKEVARLTGKDYRQTTFEEIGED